MDSTIKYKNIICSLLEEYGAIKKNITPNVHTKLILDTKNHHYQLISVGWHRKHFIYTVAFHFEIINGKVWIHQNNTDIMIADELHEKGIPKSDIVLNFIPERARAFSGFASISV